MMIKAIAYVKTVESKEQEGVSQCRTTDMCNGHRTI